MTGTDEDADADGAMAGTGADGEAAGGGDGVDDGEGALYVLSAQLLTPAQFPSVFGDDYPEACRALGLAPHAEGYGLVLGQDELGARWTVVIDDVSLVAVAIASWDCGMEYDLSPDDRTIVASLAGWPLDLAVSAPGVPEPHDPEQGADGTGRVPLSPPRTDVWGPAQRRMGADEIALQWTAWREQYVAPEAVDSASGDDGSADGAPAESDAGSAAAGSAGGGSTDAGSAGEAGRDAAAAARPGSTGVRRVLDEARAYTQNPPPPGRIRSTFASGDARTLRVDGPGWSLVARTDDMAFVLLDEEPGQVRPIGRGPELPGLLESLDKIAVRPT
ncbi:hypothetical protein OG764_31855 [Streptomyces sp. NBC_00239]|nr:hypothetical protein [Streptomyces sp. NBC_00239]